MRKSSSLRPISPWGIILLATLLMSCGENRHTGARLGGTVLLDGQPIATGTLEFRPKDQGPAAVAQAEIHEGRYLAQDVPVGKVLVLFKATRKTGKNVLVYAQSIPEVENIIPARYRRGIEIEVTGDNPNLNFELSSKSTR